MTTDVELTPMLRAGSSSTREVHARGLVGLLGTATGPS